MTVESANPLHDCAPTGLVRGRAELALPASRQTLGRARILYVIKNLQQGGTELQLLQLLRSLDRRKFDYRLCTLIADRDGVGAGVDVDHRALDASGDVVDRLVRIIDEYRPDVVHAFRDRVNLLACRAVARSRHKPRLLVSVRGRPVSLLYLAMGRFIAHRAYKFTVNSRAIADFLVRRCGVPPHQIAVIDNLADPYAFTPASVPGRLAARRALGLPADAFVWVLPARLSYVKNQLGLVSAFAHARRAGAVGPHVRLVLAGRPRDRLPSWLLPRWIRLLGLAGQVEIRPPLVESRQLYHAADALVLPSWAEGMPNVVIEAQLCGLPVVVSRQANRDEIVRPGEGGLVVPTGRRRALAASLAEISSMTREARQAMGARGRAAVLQRFGAGHSNAERFEALYLEALAPSR
jgi:glycosyltransferase involved in cell wall biosynthesis